MGIAMISWGTAKVALFMKLGILLSGFAFGTPWMLVPALEMEWYGSANFGRIHGVMMLAAGFGLALLRIVPLRWMLCPLALSAFATMAKCLLGAPERSSREILLAETAEGCTSSFVSLSSTKSATAIT